MTSPAVDVWEPWQPVVGDRVKVVYRAECPISDAPETDQAHGRVALISRIAPRGHFYYVMLDTMRPVWCAAIELEPLKGP